MRTGKVKESILKRSVLRQLNTGHSVFPVRINPVEGWTLAAKRVVYGAVNALAATEAKARTLAVTVLMPPGTEEKQLKEFMSELSSLCHREGITISAGHTAVTPSVNTLLLSVAGIGEKMDLAKPGNTDRAEGMDVIMTGHAGREGAALLAIEKEEELMTRYPLSYIETAAHFYDDAGQLEAASLLWENGALGIQNVREGGVFGALWELAVACRVGLDIELTSIPIRQHTIEICEFYDLNPYMLLSGGCLLAVCPKGKAAVDALAEHGIAAELIGRTTADNDRVIRYDTETRYLEPPGTDEIYKIDRM